MMTGILTQGCVSPLLVVTILSVIPFFHQNGEIAMLGEITHLQAIIDDLTVLTTDPHKLPPASEQVQHAQASTALKLQQEHSFSTISLLWEDHSRSCEGFMV